MLKRLSMLVATSALAAACASSPDVAGPNAGTTAGGAVSLTPGAASIANMAATTMWASEERLLPQDPILALVSTDGSVDSPAGFAITCNPDNGKMVGHLGKQPADKLGTSATYRIRLGEEAKRVKGTFETDAATSETTFVFDIDSLSIRKMAQLEMAAVLDEQGQTQWAFVSNPSAAVSALYIGSLNGLDEASQNFLVFCNPK